MKIVPLRDNVLIEADKPQDMITKSGIVLAEVQKEWKSHPHFGVVKAVGPLVKDVIVGDRVRFNRYAYEKVGEHDFLGLDRNIVAKVLN